MVPTSLSLIGTGVTLGVFHVLTGPDHLSAIATLSANVGNFQAFYLGVRWGLGHSTGLLLVGVVLILLNDAASSADDDKIQVPDQVTTVFESLVGVFMILLGAYGLKRAWEKRPKVYGIIQPDPSALAEDPDVEIPSISTESYHNHANLHHSLTPESETQDSDETDPALSENEELDDDASFINFCQRLTRNVSTKSLAILAGIIHGLAGPGGVLGVIPAVQLHNWRLATIYLGFFCLSSTLTMGIFAAFYGSCSARLGQGVGTHREFLIECVSSSLSVLVGITWLTLLSLGKLEDVFG